MKAGDISLEGNRVFYAYRGKGGKRGRRELPRPEYEAIRTALAAFGLDMATLPPDASLWPSRAGTAKGLTSGTFYGNLQR